jgi:hypothetical protein
VRLRADSREEKEFGGNAGGHIRRHPSRTTIDGPAQLLAHFLSEPDTKNHADENDARE